MTEGEIDMVRDIFGDDINYSKVRIYNKRYGFIQRRGVAMAPDGNIYFHPSDYRDDFSILSIWDQGWFVHEITHVWQRQQGINVLRAAFNRKYDYSPLRAGKSFRSYGLEQQADIVRDYFLVKRGYRPYWGNHTIDEYEAILPFGR